MKAAIVVDDYKLPVFRRRLSESGYQFEEMAGVTADTKTLTVQTENLSALADVVKAANRESKLVGARQ